MYDRVSWYILHGRSDPHRRPSLLGNMSHPLWFTFGLVQLTNDNGPVKVGWVTKAFSIPGVMDKMVMVFVLCTAIQYGFAVVSYVYVWHYFPDLERTCSTLFQCFLTIFFEGLKSDGMADAMRGIMDDGFPKHIWSAGEDGNTGFGVSFYGWIFFVAIDLLLVVIVTSIVIDAFTQMRCILLFSLACAFCPLFIWDCVFGREDGLEHEEQLDSECFICGLNTEDFSKTSRDDYDVHVRTEHNAWDYCAYFLHLHLKCEEPASARMSSQELYVLKHIAPPRFQTGSTAKALQPQPLSIKFFPQGRSIALEKQMAGDREEAEENSLDGEVN